MTIKINEMLTAHDLQIKNMGIDEMTDALRRALALYSLVREHQREGGKLVFRHEGGEEEILNVE